MTLSLKNPSLINLFQPALSMPVTKFCSWKTQAYHCATSETGKRTSLTAGPNPAAGAPLHKHCHLFLYNGGSGEPTSTETCRLETARGQKGSKKTTSGNEHRMFSRICGGSPGRDCQWMGPHKVQLWGPMRPKRTHKKIALQPRPSERVKDTTMQVWADSQSKLGDCDPILAELLRHVMLVISAVHLSVALFDKDW